jgi:RNA polymerase sigma-70 factor (ECF subfamily)
MKPGDTSLGGGEKAFPETTMGFAAGLPGGEAASLETLCRRYWKPVYGYLRIAWAKSNEDAKDATQAFFAWLLEGDALRRYEPAKGGFRAYLKVLLRRFAGHDERDRHRLKRGGAGPVLPLEGDLPGLPSGDDPEKAFESVWFEEVVNDALRQVRDARPDRFRVYEAYAMVAEPPSYAELAARMNLTVGEVEKALYFVREEIRAEIRRRLARDGEVEDDWKRLLGE